jgi:predicted  nucleic acid-binding Zn-ribbon protein
MSKNAVIGSIREKVRLLIADNRKLRGEVQHSLQQHDKLRGENRALKEELAKAEKRIAKLELQEGLASGGGDKKAARARVNRLIREVDKCVALLNK